jgi:hypothetical protein
MAEIGLDDFRVHRGAVEIAYLKRDRHQDLHDRLVEGSPVLVAGHSMAGKTRMAYEVAQELYGQWHVWIPERPDGLSSLLVDGIPQQTVVWLDDLESYLTAEEPLRLSWLTKLELAGCRVVATMRESEYEKFQPIGEVRHPQWEVLERFALVRLKDDPAEQNRIADTVVDTSVAAGIRRYGVGEYVGGGYLALDRFENGQSAHPLGVAMLRAAADWQLLGFEMISNSTLSDLASAYLTEKTRNEPGENNDAALEWATAAFGGRIRLLARVGEGWQVFDYLLDQLAGGDASIPDETWTAATDAVQANPKQAMTLGYYAYRSGRTNLAADMWQQAAITIPSAAVSLGALRAKQGDRIGAVGVFQLAIDSGHVDAAPRAAAALGALLWEQDDLTGAVAAYQLAIDSGHADAMPRAAVDLGLLRAEQGKGDRFRAC